MSEPRSADPPQVKPRSPGGPLFWAGVLVGWAVMAVGVRGLFEDELASRPGQVARLFIEAALLHDLLLAPLVILAGVLVARLLKPPVRALVQGGLVATALIALFAFPFVRGYGRTPTNPSALTVNYGRGLVVMLAGVWAVVAGLYAWQRYRRRAPQGVEGGTAGA